MNIRKDIFFLFLLIININVWSQYYGIRTDIKVLVVIEENSQYASVLYASGKKEILDVSSKLWTEINTCLELEIWIKEKSYFQGCPINVYGDEEYVKSFLKTVNKY